MNSFARAITTIRFVHREIISVQRNSCLNKPGSRLPCFFHASCSKYERRNLLLHWLKNHPHSLRFARNPISLSLRNGDNHTSIGRLMLDRAHLYPSPALQTLQQRNIYQKKMYKSCSIQKLADCRIKIQQFLVLCVQFKTWQAPPHTIDRFYNPSVQALLFIAPCAFSSKRYFDTVCRLGSIFW